MQDQVASPGWKLISAWIAALGIGSWSDAAAMLAALYSVLLIGEWTWKHGLRQFFVDRGLIK